MMITFSCPAESSSTPEHDILRMAAYVALHLELDHFLARPEGAFGLLRDFNSNDPLGVEPSPANEQ